MQSSSPHALLFSSAGSYLDWCDVHQAAVVSVSQLVPRKSEPPATSLDDPDSFAGLMRFTERWGELWWTRIRLGTLNGHPWFASRGLGTGEVIWFETYDDERLQPQIKAALESLNVKGMLGVEPIDEVMGRLPVSGVLVEGVYYGMSIHGLADDMPCVSTDGLPVDVSMLLGPDKDPADAAMELVTHASWAARRAHQRLRDRGHAGSLYDDSDLEESK